MLYYNPQFENEETEAQGRKVLAQGHRLTLGYCTAGLTSRLAPPSEHGQEQFNPCLHCRPSPSLDSPRGHLGMPGLSTLFTRLTSRASAPQNTLRETLKLVQIERVSWLRNLHYLRNRSESRVNRDGICSFSREGGQPHLPNKPCISDVPTAPGAPQCQCSSRDVPTIKH